MRKMGKITDELEKVISEMIDDHDLQKGEVLALVNAYIDIHYPGAIEVYEEDDSNPIFRYGPKK